MTLPASRVDRGVIDYALEVGAASKGRLLARWVSSILAAHSDADGLTFISVEKLAHFTGSDRKGVRAALRQLVALGEVEQVEPGRARRSARYRVLVELGGAEPPSALGSAEPLRPDVLGGQLGGRIGGCGPPEAEAEGLTTTSFPPTSAVPREEGEAGFEDRRAGAAA